MVSNPTYFDLINMKNDSPVRRRRLSFANLEEVMPEVERLLAGHVTVGRWSLGQICWHLAVVFNLLVDSLPGHVPPGRVQRVCSWFLRRWFFSFGGFPTGVRASMSEVVPGQGLDERSEAEALRVALTRFLDAPGPFPAHPYLGLMTRDQWVAFNRRHCAHHLGFAVPIERGLEQDIACHETGVKRLATSSTTIE